MIGVQISTYNRPEVLEYSISQFDKYRRDEMMIVIDDNSDCGDQNKAICDKYNVSYLYNETRRGIPRTKERGFASMLHCDYQFWFDDDCFPIDDWQEALTDATDWSHILYLKEWAHIKPIEVIEEFTVYSGATACFMSFREEMYEYIHGFHSDKLIYGGWHYELSQNLAKYGLGEYVSLTNIGCYLWSMDMDGVPKDFKGEFKSSLPLKERIKK